MNKAQLAKQVLHDHVVLMGIDAQVPALREGPLETVLARALDGAVRGDAMHHAVGLIPNPGSVVNLVVGSFASERKSLTLVSVMRIRATLC